MDPESKDKSNNCETDDSAMDTSSINNNNLKEGVKKVLGVNNVNTEDSSMEVDNESTSVNDKYSEKKNGMHDDNDKKENQKASVQLNNEKVTANHEQNDADGSSSKTVNDDGSSSVSQSEQNCQNENEKKDQSTEKSVEPVSNSSEHSENGRKNDCDDSSAAGETPMDVDVSSEKDSSKNESSASSSESAKDNVRPSDKGSTPEMIVSDGVTEENSSKVESSDKETKDKTSSEAPSEAVNSKEAKGKETSDSTPSETKTESTKKEGESSGKKKKSKTCEECGVKKGLKFQVLFKGKTRFLCSDTCFKNFKSKQMQTKPPEPAPPAPQVKPPPTEKCGQCQKDIPANQGLFPTVGEAKPLCSEDCMKKYNMDHMPTKSCSQCKKVIENLQNPDILTWETMVFCNEDCLGKYQSYLGSHCTCCQSPVPQASLGKYSVCFGADIRQFCSCSCLDDFKKNLKVCSFCQTDLSAGVDSFLAPVGDKGQFKDFCSQNCMERYEVMNNISKSTPQAQVCTQCKKQGTFKIQVKHENQSYSLCSDLCISGFRYSHKIKDKMCDTCFNFFHMAADKDFSFKFDGQSKHFCTKACMTLFVLSHRKIVACVSCKVKKYNFDMIEKTDNNNQTQIFCSLNCLSLYRVSVNATSSKSVRCDNCAKNLPAQYHLTMSDGSVRNFCNYNCVMIFQNQYTNVCTLTSTSATRQTSASTSTSKTSTATSTPVISNVVSLAAATPRPTGPTLIRNIVPPKLVPATRQPMQPLAIIGSKIYSLTPATRTVTPVLSKNLPSKLDPDQQPLDSKSATSTITSPSPMGAVTNASGQQVIREVIVKPPAPKSQKNKSVACKPIMQSKGINVKPQPCHKAVQTDDSPRPILVPIPVPVYVPVPLHMFSRPVPCPVPFGVPIPVPIVVPSSKGSSSQERVSSNSVENNCVSSEKVSEDRHNNRIGGSPKENNDGCGKEVASSMTVDEPCSSTTSEEYNDANNDESDDYVLKDGKSHLGKRHASSHHHKSKGRKRSKTDDMVVEEAKSLNAIPPDENRNNSVQNDLPEQVPRLKHTFGVNAWKQWVLQKNEQMEKGSQSSRKFKLFKTDLLQLPPDELNYSLSLFVKEVRKPSGEEYCCGSLYYLCLGIQKYLFQNGRIDNIFSDPYYDKFTECLNDILQNQPIDLTFETTRSVGIEEEALWESKQLGAHSPYALLNTVMYFNTKFFNFNTVEDHIHLSFTHLRSLWKKRRHSQSNEKIGRFRFYPKEYLKTDDDEETDSEEDERNKLRSPNDPRKDELDNPYCEEFENPVDTMRCPVRLYEFYVSKVPMECKDLPGEPKKPFYYLPDPSILNDCSRWLEDYLKKKGDDRPESSRSRNDAFYLSPERSCIPDSTMWYSTQPLSQDIIAKMLQRFKIVKDIYKP